MPMERRINWMITYHRPEDEPATHPDELEPDSIDRPNVEQEFVNKVRQVNKQNKDKKNPKQKRGEQ